MKRVTGVGGIFFKAKNPEKLNQWYEEHLGLKAEHGSVEFKWRDNDRPEIGGKTIWATFPEDTTYFSPGTAPFMINYRVEDLDALIALLRDEGVSVSDKPEDTDYGRFAWATEPEGNRIELWEPPANVD